MISATMQHIGHCHCIFDCSVLCSFYYNVFYLSGYWYVVSKLAVNLNLLSLFLLSYFRVKSSSYGAFKATDALLPPSTNYVIGVQWNRKYAQERKINELVTVRYSVFLFLTNYKNNKIARVRKINLLLLV